MKQTIRLRRARKQDLLPAFKMIMHTLNHLRKKNGMSPVPTNWRELPPVPKHLYDTDSPTAWCAWRGEKLVGYGHALIRGKQWYLAFLFVHPSVQDKGVGRMLLEKVWRDGQGVTHALCTFSYNPQAVGIYSQFGMSPTDNFPLLSCPIDRLRPPKRPGLEFTTKLTAADVAWINRLEGEIRGYRRSQEWKLWTTEPSFVPYIFRDKGKRVGYGVIYKNSSVGPVGAVSDAYLLKVTAELLNLPKAQDDQILKFWTPSSNIELYQMLINAKFRCEEIAVFMTDKSYSDFQRYVPTHLAIF